MRNLDQSRRELGLFDDLTAEAIRFLEARGLLCGVHFLSEDAISIAVELIGEAR